MVDKIVEAIESAEKQLGRRIPDGIWLDVLCHSYQKLPYIKKTEEYLPVLFQNELTDYYTRLDINMRGVAENVQRMLAEPMSSPMPQCS